MAAISSTGTGRRRVVLIIKPATETFSTSSDCTPRRRGTIRHQRRQGRASVLRALQGWSSRRRFAHNLVTSDETRRTANGIARLPEFMMQRKDLHHALAVVTLQRVIDPPSKQSMAFVGVKGSCAIRADA